MAERFIYNPYILGFQLLIEAVLLFSVPNLVIGYRQLAPAVLLLVNLVLAIVFGVMLLIEFTGYTRTVEISDENMVFRDYEGETRVYWDDIRDALYYRSYWILQMSNGQSLRIDLSNFGFRDLRRINALIHKRLISLGFNKKGRIQWSYEKASIGPS